MDPSVIEAMKKWPDVPALFGWLGLDRRGRMLLQGKPIERAALIDFIGRNYEADEQGRWFFQNGPQRAYFTLEYTPWVLRVDGGARLRTHTDVAVAAISSAWLDEDGSLLLGWQGGIALLDDADLGWAFERLVDAQGKRPDESSLMRQLEQLQVKEPANLHLEYAADRVLIQPITAAEVPHRFGFVREPTA